jgi:hypothetical protein
MTLSITTFSIQPKNLAREKHSYLLTRKVIRLLTYLQILFKYAETNILAYFYEALVTSKKFDNIDTCHQQYKTFYFVRSDPD